MAKFKNSAKSQFSKVEEITLSFFAKTEKYVSYMCDTHGLVMLKKDNDNALCPMCKSQLKPISDEKIREVQEKVESYK